MKPPRTSIWWMIALLFVAVAVAYVPAYHADFIWDDDDYVTQNEVLRSFGGLVRIWIEPTSIPQYYPLVHTTFWVEYQLWGLAPLGYHLVNLLLHATAASLLLVVLRRLQVPGAWFAALVFAVHPVHVESVAWITERKNVLSGVFYLWALLAWLRWRPLDGSPDTGSRGAYWKVLLLFVCALFSKTIACSLPAAILLLIWWKKGRVERRDLTAALPMFAIGVAMAAVTVWLERVHVVAEGAAWDYSLVERLLIAGRAVWFYAGKLLWPVALTFNYPKWVIDSGDMLAWLYPAAVLATVVALWTLRHRIGRAPLVAWLFFGGTLVPALGFVDVFPMRYSFVADHFQYLASLGPIVLISAFATTTVAARRGVGIALATVLLAGLGTLTWRQCRAYDGHVALWTDTLAKNPGSGIAHTNLGKILTDRGEFDRAVPHLEAALALDDALWEAHASLGVVRMNLGDRAAARTHFERVVEQQPKQPAGHVNLGLVMIDDGELEAATAQLEIALAIAPRVPEIHSALAMAHAKLGDKPEALRYLSAALEIAPNHSKTLLNAADVMMVLGDPRKAIEISVAVLGALPGNTLAIDRLARGIAQLTADASPEDTIRAADEACRVIAGQAPAVLAALAHELDAADRPAAAAAVSAHAERAPR